MIKYTGDFKDGEIESAGFIVNNYNWTFTIKDNIDYSDKWIGVKYSYFYLDPQPWDGNAFFIGPTKFWFKTIYGKEYEYIHDVNIKGKKGSEGYDYVYSEHFARQHDKDELAYKGYECLKIPVIEKYEFINEILTIQFSCSDNDFYDGLIYFYDKNRTFIAKSELFRSKDGMSINKLINNGLKINNDGEINLVICNLRDLDYGPDKRPEDIISFAVEICDGKQYASDRPGAYDFESFSKLTTLLE
jgi:hypothetical protein